MLGDRPTDLPDLRLWLLDQWRPGRPYYEVSKDPRVKFTLSAKDLKPEQVRTIPFGEWEFKQLEQATLWWGVG